MVADETLTPVSLPLPGWRESGVRGALDAI